VRREVADRGVDEGALRLSRTVFEADDVLDLGPERDQVFERRTELHDLFRDLPILVHGLSPFFGQGLDTGLHFDKIPAGTVLAVIHPPPLVGEGTMTLLAPGDVVIRQCPARERFASERFVQGHSPVEL
jgi:hypothetical protein